MPALILIKLLADVVHSALEARPRLLLLRRETQVSLDARNARVQFSDNLVCGQIDAVGTVTRDRRTCESGPG